MARFWEDIARDEAVPVIERIRQLFEIVDDNTLERPLVAVGALREILALDPVHARAQQLYERVAGGELNSVRSMRRVTGAVVRGTKGPDLPTLVDWWIEEAEFFIAQGLWDEAREALAEARSVDADDPRLPAWIAYVEAERAAARSAA